MSDYLIATASTCDIDREWLDNHGVPVISYSFEIEGEIYADDCREETKRLLYAKMREGKLPNTSQITVYNYYEFFKKLLEQSKKVIFVDMDKAISNSYNNSVNAAEQIREKFPDADLRIMDTRCITMGLAFLVKKLVAMKEDGASFEEVCDWCDNNCRKIIHRFMIDDLQWLRRGGRLSNASAMIGSLLSIKPLIYVPDDGTLVAYNKVRGRKKAIHEMLEDAAAEAGSLAGQDIIVGHSDCLEDGEKWLEMVREKFPEAASVTLQELGPTIACHVGPGFLSIVYMANHRKEF